MVGYEHEIKNENAKCEYGKWQAHSKTQHTPKSRSTEHQHPPGVFTEHIVLIFILLTKPKKQNQHAKTRCSHGRLVF
jgi:hypothetical protein